MTRGVQVIRLAVSVIVASAACFFVVMYDQMSAIRYPFDHPDAEGYHAESGEFVSYERTPASLFITSHRTHAFAVPLAGLLLGLLILWRWPTFHSLIELVMSSMWVLGLVWAGFVLVVWQVNNIPMFHGMRLHY
jgi:hypothetical protein